MGIDLFGDSDQNTDEADLVKIEINKEFAKRFEHNKKREALHRLEELKKRGLAGESDDSSEESSDDNAERIAAYGKKELQLYDALVRVKKKDPTMHHKDVKIFSSSSDDEEEAVEEKMPKKMKKKKPLYLKDVNARQLMDDGPEFEDEPLKENPKVYNREQAEGLKAFLEAEKEAFDSVVDENVIKLKEKRSIDGEEDDNAGEIRKRLDEYFGDDGNLSENDMFLKNYLLKRMWVDEDKVTRPSLDGLGVSEDEDELERQDRYEAEYNFRHEEGQAERVLGYSRIIEGSVRKKSNSRKEQRKSKEERLIRAEFERREELKHLKNLKKKEIQEKLEKIRETAGMGEDAFCNLDLAQLEEEFDPEEYDKTMRQMFDVEYYNTEDVDPGFGSDVGDDLEKPDFSKDKLMGLPKDWDSMDTMEGFEALRKVILRKNDEEKEPSNEEGKRKKKRTISYREKFELDKELEQYYKLDYEGTVGDLKTRFKYRSVPANSFGLQAEEVLMANDKDLNQYVSLKRLAPYREKEWKVTYHQKLKKHMILHGKQDGKTSIRKHLTGEFTNARKADKEIESSGDANVLSKRSRKRRKHALLKLSKSRLMAYGKISSNPHKKR